MLVWKKGRCVNPLKIVKVYILDKPIFTKNAIKVSVSTKVGTETRATTERLIFEGVPLFPGNRGRPSK